MSSPVGDRIQVVRKVPIKCGACGNGALVYTYQRLVANGFARSQSTYCWCETCAQRHFDALKESDQDQP